MCGQIFTRRCELEIWLVCSVRCGIVWAMVVRSANFPGTIHSLRSDNDRIEAEFADFANLLTALFQKLIRMLCCRNFGCRSVIQLFLIAGAGDPMVLHAG